MSDKERELPGMTVRADKPTRVGGRRIKSAAERHKVIIRDNIPRLITLDPEYEFALHAELAQRNIEPPPLEWRQMGPLKTNTLPAEPISEVAANVDSQRWHERMQRNPNVSETKKRILRNIRRTDI